MFISSIGHGNGKDGDKDESGEAQEVNGGNVTTKEFQQRLLRK